MATEKSDNGLFVGSLKAIARIFFGWVSTLYMGWVLATLWGWFAVPYLGLPAITVLGGIAISLIYTAIVLPGEVKNFLASGITIKNDKEHAKLSDWLDILSTPVCATVVLIGGSFWHYFVIPVLLGLGVS